MDPSQPLIEDLIALAQQADALADQMRPVLAAITAKEDEIARALSPNAMTHISGRFGNAGYAHTRCQFDGAPENSRSVEEIIRKGYANEIAAFPPEEEPEA